MGFHIVGRWEAAWRQSAGATARHMLYLEILPPVVTMLIMSHARKRNVWCVTLDNAGAAFVLNRLSSTHAGVVAATS